MSHYTPTVTLADLPGEVLNEVIRHLADDIPSLSFFNATSHLYHQTTTADLYNTYSTQNQDSMLSFLLTTYETPSLRPHVRSVRFDLNVDGPDSCPDLLQYLLELADGLRTTSSPDLHRVAETVALSWYAELDPLPEDAWFELLGAVWGGRVFENVEEVVVPREWLDRGFEVHEVFPRAAITAVD